MNSFMASLQKSSEHTVRILMAEDNEVNRKLVGLLLKRFGYDLDTAEDGQQAIDLIKGGNEYDCLLLDLKMPGLDGYDVTRILRGELKNGIPIIAITADTSEEERKKCLAAGMNDFLSKPFEPSMLQKKISALIGNGTAEQEDIHPEEDIQTGSLNLKYIKEITQGDPEQQRQLVELFLSSTPGMLHDLKMLYDTGKYDEMRKLAHKIRSGASVMLTSGPLKLLHQVEHTPAGNEKKEELGEKIGLFTHICNEALNELKNLKW
jgi:two-component system, sensor histidine kinase